MVTLPVVSRRRRRTALPLALAAAFAFAPSGVAVGQGAHGPTVSGPPAKSGWRPGRPPHPRPSPARLQVHVDAEAVLADWWARNPPSQSGTTRSGVRVNGVPAAGLATAREILFACRPASFLDVTVIRRNPDGTARHEKGPRPGCPAGQALALENGRLFCAWYTPPPDAAYAAGAPPPEIVLHDDPPLSLVGECVTPAAEVVPALTGPPTRPPVASPPCAGSGATVNGRVYGFRAGCGG